jgi:geranylgeranyl reductase family protein
MKSDLIVVGAGPTGTFSALQAARLGVEVTVFEEHDTIGFPSHCTGHLSLRGLKRLGLDLTGGIVENNFRKATIYSPSGCTFSVEFSSPVTCIVDRELFDKHIGNMAVKAGVEILSGTRVDSLLLENGCIRGVSLKQRKAAEFKSDVVIDAEGVASTLLKRVGIPTLDPQMIVSGVEAEVDEAENLNLDCVEIYLDRRLARGFFAWIAPRRNDTAKIGLATVEGDPRRNLQHFVLKHRIAKQKLGRSTIRSIVCHPISLGGPISRTTYGGLLIVGDAASQVKPTTGGGVITGLTCAEIAGSIAAKAILRRDTSAGFLSEYEKRWKKTLGFDMWLMRSLRTMLNRFSDKQLDQIVSRCDKLELAEDLKDVEDVDFQGTSLLRLSKRPRILLSALYFLKASLF